MQHPTAMSHSPGDRAAMRARRPFAPSAWPVFYGWPILVFASMGAWMSAPAQTIGVAVFTDHLIAALGLTRGQLSLAYMAGTLGSALMLPFGGSLCDRFGSRAAAVAASLSLGTVLLVLSRSDTLAAAVAGWGVPDATAAFGVMLLGFFALRFSGQGMLTLASQTMVARWFDRKRGLASGISGVLVALGFASAPLLFDRLIARFGWRGAWVAMAAVVGGVFAALALAFYRDNPEDCGLRPDGVSVRTARGRADGRPAAAADWTRREARETWAFWAFSFSIALLGLYLTGLTFHVVSVFETGGMARAQAVRIFLPTSVVGVSTHLVAGWLSDRVPLSRLLRFMLLAIMLSTVGLAGLAPGWPVVALVLGNGMSGGLAGLLGGVAWARLFGRRHLGAIGGLHLSVAVLFSAIGPVLFSQSLVWSGSYRAAAGISALAAALLFAASFRIRAPAREGEGRS